MLTYSSLNWSASFCAIFQNPVKPRTHVNLFLTLNLGKLRNCGSKVGCKNLNVCAKLLEDRKNNTILLLNQCPKEMFWSELGVSLLLRVGLCGLQRFLALQRELVKSNHRLLRQKRCCGLPMVLGIRSNFTSFRRSESALASPAPSWAGQSSEFHPCSLPESFPRRRLRE